MQFTGESTWTNEKGEIIGGSKVTKAFVEKSKITFDFIQDNKTLTATLKSDDGIHYSGIYEWSHKPKEKVRFDLYQNIAGEYFLFGSYEGYDTANEGSGKWWAELKPQREGTAYVRRNDDKPHFCYSDFDSIFYL